MEKRKFSSSICVKNNAKTTQKIELFPSEQWQDGPAGCYRVRINRKWHHTPEGKVYCTPATVMHLVTSLALDTLPQLPEAPIIPCRSRVSAPNGKVLDGVPLYDATYTTTPPFRGYDGDFYVGVYLYGQGVQMVRASELVLKSKANH